jgi:hypothetical protein
MCGYGACVLECRGSVCCASLLGNTIDRTTLQHTGPVTTHYDIPQWHTGGGGVTPSPSTINSEVLTTELNSQFRGKLIRNNLIRIRVSLICKLSGTLTRGLLPPPPPPRSPFYLPAVLNWIWWNSPEKISWVRHWYTTYEAPWWWQTIAETCSSQYME